MHGVYAATTDDHLHSAEAGMIMYISQVAHHPLTAKEQTAFEREVRQMLSGHKSSVSSDYPCGRTKKGFSRLTLMSHSEKVGTVLNLLIALQKEPARKIFQARHKQQQVKYTTFPTLSQLKANKHIRGSAAKKKKAPTNKKWKKAAQNVDDEEDESEGEDQLESEEVAEGQDDPTKENEQQQVEEEEEDDVEDDETVAGANLPAEAFLYRKDRFFGKESTFDRSDDEDIDFIFEHLRRHGFGFLMDEVLDEYQIEQLLTGSWKVLKALRNKTNMKKGDFGYPTPQDVESLNGNDFLSGLLRPIHDDSNHLIFGSSPLVESVKELLRRDPQHRQIITNPLLIGTGTVNEIPYQTSVSIPGCIPKHRRHKPKIKKVGNTAAVLSDIPTFCAFLEYLLAYHSWCHYSYLLPADLREDMATVDYGVRFLVQLFDKVLYRGDSSVDADTCKIHSQLHTSRLCDYFGDLMQYNTELGERRLKDWAKFVSNTALERTISP